jgi:hypothetical protein
LPGDEAVELPGEIHPEQRLVVRGQTADRGRVEAAGIRAIDEIERGDVGIGAELSSGDDEVPAFVADVDAERGALGAEWAVADIADAGRDQRAAVGIDRIRVRRQQAPGDIIRVIHQVPADQATAVGDAVAHAAGS